MVDSAYHKARLHQLDFIGEFLQTNVKNGVFMNLDSRYAEYFSEYSNYFGRALRLMKSMHGMTNYGKIFTDELTKWLLEAGFTQYKCQVSINYKCALDGTQIVVLPNVDNCVYWYTYVALVKLFVYTLGKQFHMKY